MPSEVARLLRIHLIQRDRISIRALTTDWRAGQVLIRIRMAMNVSCVRVRKPGIDRNVTPQRLEHIKHFAELKILFTATRKPAPVLPRRIGFEWQSNSVRVIDAEESFRSFIQTRTADSKRLKPRQSQSNTGALKKSATTQQIKCVVHGRSLFSIGCFHIVRATSGVQIVQ